MYTFLSKSPDLGSFISFFIGTAIPVQLRERPPDEDLTLLHSIVPENVTRAVNELMMRPPPRLKARPPGMLSNVFDDGIPSSAGEITAKINSVAHRVSVDNLINSDCITYIYS